jgi:hypothetical protein
VIEERGDGACRPVLLQPPDCPVARLGIARAQAENVPPLSEGGAAADGGYPEDAEADGADQEEDAVLPELQVGIVSLLPEKIVRARCARKGNSCRWA